MRAKSTPSKGAQTREAILERAYGLAVTAGLEGLSIGPLAEAVGMSKSGVFAHFGSREDLQLAVLDFAAQKFAEHTLMPALKARRGLPRLRQIVDRWFEWLTAERGGCLLLAAVSEYDALSGPLHERVISHHLRWRREIVRAVAMAVESGELTAETDPEQLAFEINAIALGAQHDRAIAGETLAAARGRRMFEHLLHRCLPAPRGTV